MKNLISYIGILVSVIVIAAVFMISFRESDEAAKFLKSYSWEVETAPVETVEIKIPAEFDEVYNNYNELQKAAGLDLEPYKGKNAVRYTFIVLNYPEPAEAEVRANVIVVDGKPVAGDISTVALDGFMHSLNMNTSACFSIQIDKG